MKGGLMQGVWSLILLYSFTIVQLQIQFYKSLLDCVIWVLLFTFDQPVLILWVCLLFFFFFQSSWFSCALSGFEKLAQIISLDNQSRANIGLIRSCRDLARRAVTESCALLPSPAHVVTSGGLSSAAEGQAEPSFLCKFLLIPFLVQIWLALYYTFSWWSPRADGIRGRKRGWIHVHAVILYCVLGKKAFISLFAQILVLE